MIQPGNRGQDRQFEQGLETLQLLVVERLKNRIGEPAHQEVHLARATVPAPKVQPLDRDFTLGRHYQPDRVAQSERIRRVIRAQSFDGEFFVDNAVRKDGALEVTRNRTEVCQYFAFFFDVATPKTHAALWQKLAHQFGPQRKQTQAFPEIHPANAFVGNYLRSELLSQNGHAPQIKKELVDFYLYMAEQTGTLWEHVGASASCNHGFASHVAFSLYRDVLGVFALDTQEKTIQLRLTDVGLDWCEGRIMTPQGPVVVKWWTQDGELSCRTQAPAGYAIKIDNRTGLRLSLQ